MSKQSDAKADQNYREKPVWRECRNCKHFTMGSDVVMQCGHQYVQESKVRCLLGNFKVKKLATCDKHEMLP